MQELQRIQEIQGIERDSYIVLLHLYTLTEVATVQCLSTSRLIRELGLPELCAEQIVRSLLTAEYIEYCGSGEGLVLSRKGVHYVEKEAGRRRSLRLMS